jgi:hypothetical protein
MNAIITKAIMELDRVMTEHATACMLYPKPDPYGHGVQVGSYHGVLKAKEVLQDILKDDEERNG